MHMISNLLGRQHSSAYKDQFKWTTKSGDALNRAAFEWHAKGRNPNYEVKPEGWLSREEMTSQISDLNKRYDALKIDYDKLSQQPQHAPSVQASHAGWRDVHGGYGEQTTQVDNKAAAAAKPKKTASITPSSSKTPQTYTGTATL